MHERVRGPDALGASSTNMTWSRDAIHFLAPIGAAVGFRWPTPANSAKSGQQAQRSQQGRANGALLSRADLS
jgi:hypothetical protein